MPTNPRQDEHRKTQPCGCNNRIASSFGTVEQRRSQNGEKCGETSQSKFPCNLRELIVRIFAPHEEAGEFR